MYSNDYLTIYECTTDDPTLKLIRIDMTHMPDDDGINVLCTELVTYCQNATTRAIIHFRHVKTEDMQPPSMHSMFAIAARLMENQDAVNKTIRGTIIQGTRIDDTVRVAHSLFKNVYKPQRMFEIVDNDETSMAHIKDVVKSRLKRRNVT